MIRGKATDPDYYDKNYRSYDSQNPPHKLAHYLSQIEGAAHFDRPSLLDVGCGRGAFLKHVAQERPNWQLFGCDVNEGAVLQIQRDLFGKAEVILQSAEQRPFASTEFDIITALDVLEHLDDPSAAVRMISDALKPVGVALLVVPVYDGITGPIIRRLDKDETHIQKLPRDSWIRLVREHFSDVRWHGVYRLLVSRNWYIHIPTRRLRRATPAVILTCRK